MFTYLNLKVEELKNKIIKDPKLNKNPHALMAIRDAALLLSYCYREFENIVGDNDDLDEILK